MNLETAIAPAAVALVVLLARRRRSETNAALWSSNTRKLARDYGMPVREDITDRITEYVRWQSLLGAVVLGTAGVCMSFALPSLDSDNNAPHQSATAYIFTTLILTLVATAASAATGLRAWNTARGRRVAHIQQPVIREIFTTHERFALWVGAAATLAGGYWGLTLTSAGMWSLLWFVALVANGAAWWWAVRLVLNRPAQANDEIELRWDDMLRHWEARELTMGSAFLPAAISFLLDWLLLSPGNLLPVYAAIAVCLVLRQIFKEGKHLWSESWDQSDPA